MEDPTNRHEEGVEDEDARLLRTSGWDGSPSPRDEVVYRHGIYRGDALAKVMTICLTLAFFSWVVYMAATGSLYW